MSAASRPRVVVTRDERTDDTFSRALAALGAAPIPFSTIAIAPALDAAPLDDALAALSSFDWLVFTSAHAVDATLARPGWPARPGNRPLVAAVGAATTERLRARGVAVTLYPPRASARDLLTAMAASPLGLAGRHVLWPRSDIARPEIADAVAGTGGTLVAPVAYRTLPMPPADAATFVLDLEAGRLDAVAFLSPSSARGLAQALPGATLAGLAGRTLVASIGPTTSGTLRALGAPPDVEATERTASELAATLCDALATRGDLRQ